MKISTIDNFPTSPGVYLMKDETGGILYVGKAKDLRSRVRSYFTRSSDSRYHIRFLMARVTGVEYIVTDTEKEALILENTLIKTHRPRYNMNLRDDKTYFSLRMDMREEFPSLTIIRKVQRDGASYFGPYCSASAAREVMKQLYKLFRLRHYPLETCRRRGRPCLFYQIIQCAAPCCGLISEEDYGTLAEGAILFLKGKNRELLKVLKGRMAEAAVAENYEEAARFRDLIRSIEVTVERQKMVVQGGDRDVLGLYREGGDMEIAVLFIRGGSLIGSRTFSLCWEMDNAEGISSFLSEYYNRDVFVPGEILLPLQIEAPTAFEELLSEKKGERVTVIFPRRGMRVDLVKLADKNAETSAMEKRRAKEGSEQTLKELQQRLHLEGIPHRIECYDISNTQGLLAVASKVAFLDGRADKENYRHYRIRTISQADDYGMMHEVLSRRFKGDPSCLDLPDLIIVDGGPGQLNVLTEVLRELGITAVAAASLAKSRVMGEMTSQKIIRSDERVFLPGRKNPVVLRQNSAPLLLLARIRDEAHRFAITYHKKLRKKETVHSLLGNIKGVGEKRLKLLLRHFGSLKRVQGATMAELLEVAGLDRRTATSVWEHYHGETAPLHEQ